MQTAAFSQSVKFPQASSSDDPTTFITEIVTNNKNTIVSFKHVCAQKGSWVQVNKSMYLQDANGEERYNFVRSEGIPVRPERFIATQDGQEVYFKVYFEKLKPGTEKINIIERARSVQELSDGIGFFNYYGVNLTKSGTPNSAALTLNETVQTDTSYVTTTIPAPFGSNGEMANIGSAMTEMYTSLIHAMLKVYSNPEITDQLAKIDRNYYNALVKAGFAPDDALKIVISKQIASASDLKR